LVELVEPLYVRLVVALSRATKEQENYENLSQQTKVTSKRQITTHNITSNTTQYETDNNTQHNTTSRGNVKLDQKLHEKIGQKTLHNCSFINNEV